MTSSLARRLTVAFVLVSYRPDEPAGMERAVAALATGLRHIGHRALILTAARQPEHATNVIELTSLPIVLPSDDDTLRNTLLAHRVALANELTFVYEQHAVDVAVYVDALWGLGRIAAAIRHRARRVLCVHVVGHRQDLVPALAGAERVVTPSESARQDAAMAGYPTEDWQITPNPLLFDPEEMPRPDAANRERLRRHGPIRCVARLGSEKGVETLLSASALPTGRPIEITLAAANFESATGSQAQLRASCVAVANQVGVRALPALRWRQVQNFLADAAVTVVPSIRETFGNVALESLSVGTPVVCFDVGNLPSLLGDGAAGVLVPRAQGAAGLWRGVRELLADPVRYAHISGAAYCRSRNYRPTIVAQAFLKAVW
jgi:iron(II)-dependent oxidoreductase